MFAPTTSLLEIVARVALIYLGMILLLRLAGKRELGQLAPLDLLGMLLLSETVSPALTGQDHSLPAGFTAAATLLLLTVLIGRACFRSRRVERWIDGEPVVLARDGKLFDQACERERISRQELDAALRKNGVLVAAETKLIMLEADGSISVVPQT